MALLLLLRRFSCRCRIYLFLQVLHEDAHVPCQHLVQLSRKRHRGKVDEDEDDDSGAEN